MELYERAWRWFQPRRAAVNGVNGYIAGFRAGQRAKAKQCT